MKRSILLPVVLALLPFTGLFSGCQKSPASQTAIPTPTEELEEKKESVGYYTGDIDSYNAVKNYSQYLSIVSADVFTVDINGNITGEDPFDVVDFNRKNNVQTYACVNNYGSDGFDAELAKAAILDHRDTSIPQLVELAEAGGYDGVNIDFENLSYSDNLAQVRIDFSTFIYELSLKLHEKNLKLMISVPAKTKDCMCDLWSYPFDYASLGYDADYLQLMTYDQHGPWSNPGAVSGTDWVEECLDYAVTQVDPAKLLIGLPAYGYNWDQSDSGITTDISWKDLPALMAASDSAITWNETVQSPSLVYSQNGHDHIVWFENSASIQAKVALMQQFNLAGLSMWALGKEIEEFWLATQTTQSD